MITLFFAMRQDATFGQR